MAKVKVALVHAPPKQLVAAEVSNLTCITEYEPEVVLPGGLTSMGVHRMAIGTLNPNVFVVMLLDGVRFLKLLALLLKETNTVVFLLLEIVRDLTVFTVNTSFGANLKVNCQFRVTNLLAALACNFSIGAIGKVLECIIVHQNSFMASLVLTIFSVWTFELLLFQLVLCKSMDRLELSVDAPDWTLRSVCGWILLNPALDTLVAKGSLALLALLRLENYLHADLTDKEVVKVLTHSIARA